MNESLGYFDGHWLPSSQLALPMDDCGLLQGAIVVERLRTYGGELFETAAHLQRLDTGTQALQLSVDPAWLGRLIDQWQAKNERWIHKQREVGLTILVTPGPSGGNASEPTILMHGNRLDLRRIDHLQQAGQRVVVTDVVQPPPASWPRSIKVRSRLHYYLADLHAKREADDAIGLLRDEDGTLTESNPASLAIVEAGCVISPPAARVLPGITQAYLRRGAIELGIGWDEQPISPRRLFAADEILLMGTTVGCWNGFAPHAKPCLQPGPVCRRFQQLLPG